MNCRKEHAAMAKRFTTQISCRPEEQEEDPFDKLVTISTDVIRHHPCHGFDDLVALWMGKNIEIRYKVDFRY